MKKVLVLSMVMLLSFAGPTTVSAQIDWEAPFPAHQMIDNVYFVGTEALGTYLITTDEGHIIINSDFESTVPILKENVENLGFNFADIKYILGSHAHGDHMQGDALLKELTGAEVVVMREDLPNLQAMRPGGKQHPADIIIEDGYTLNLGRETLTAHLTPGHTEGCTTWTWEVEENGVIYDVVVACSYGANDNYILVGNSNYPDIASDYRETYAKVRALPVDVFLGSHGFFYDLNNKYEKLLARKPGDLNPYIDPAGFNAHIDEVEQNFEAMFQAQSGN